MQNGTTTTNTRDSWTHGQQKTADYTSLPMVALSACTGADAQTKYSKMYGSADPCWMQSGTSASQNTTRHEGMLTQANALALVYNSADP